MIPERIEFGIFIAPFHHLGENPTLALRRDIELISRLDELGYDEVWIGEHHSGGWEIIASPEMFIAAAGENTTRIRLGTGVVSLPYHHPLHVADRIVLADHLTRGRAMLGVGPGALPGDARFLGLEPTRQREMMDEALGVIIQLLSCEEPVTYKSDWFQLNEAQLQLRPYQRPTMPLAVASMISPSGMTTAGKHGVGVLSLATYLPEGLAALPTQWAYCEKASAEAGHPAPERRNWRVVLPIYLAETREEAIADVEERIMPWYNDYFVNSLGAPNRQAVQSGRQLIDMMNMFGGIIGTPDDAVERIQKLYDIAGGFGCVLTLAHEWAPREKILHSYELLARHVMPEFQGTTAWPKRSREWTMANRESLMAGSQKAITKAFEKEGIDLSKQQPPF